LHHLRGRVRRVTRSVTIDVRGLPRPQGSLQVLRSPSGHVATRYPPRTYAWRAQVQQAVVQLDAEPFTGPVSVRMGFEFPRLLSHYGTGANAGKVKASAPTYPAVMPDLDKLVRCVCDAITDAGLWKDDAQVCALWAAKRYATTPPGVLITVMELP
jgi:Holliday junction resolvase RusA-like endonuclease